MATLDLAAVRKALLDSICQRLSRQVQGYTHQPDAPLLPCIIVEPGSPYVDYHETFQPGTVAQVNFEVVLQVDPGPNGTDGQRRLDDMLSSGADKPDSVIDAIEADLTLDGAVSNTFVREAVSDGRIVYPDTNTPADQRRLYVSVLLHRR